MSAVMKVKDQPLISIDKNIMDMQHALETLPEEKKLDSDELVTHHFAPGVYVREMFMPAGLIVIGKTHTTQHVSILSEGTVTVLTNSEGQVTLTGPYTFINQIGDKRAVFAHTDVVWSTIHPNPTNERDIDKLVDGLTLEGHTQ